MVIRRGVIRSHIIKKDKQTIQSPKGKEQKGQTINSKILSKKIEMCELNQKMEVNSDITEG
jgi:hypothetical protein